MNASDDSIWKRIQQKDVGTFEVYYKENYKAFFLMAFKYMKDPAKAQEIVNDVFIKIWTDASKITISHSLKAYLYRSIINTSINALSKIKTENLREMEYVKTTDESYELKEMEDNEMKAMLFNAIGQLPPQCRKVFEMSRFEDLKQKEIAEKLGISVKTVKNHITHAIKILGQSKLQVLLIPVLKILFMINKGHV